MYLCMPFCFLRLYSPYSPYKLLDTPPWKWKKFSWLLTIGVPIWTIPLIKIKTVHKYYAEIVAIHAHPYVSVQCYVSRLVRLGSSLGAYINCLVYPSPIVILISIIIMMVVVIAKKGSVYHELGLKVLGARVPVG